MACSSGPEGEYRRSAAGHDVVSPTKHWGTAPASRGNSDSMLTVALASGMSVFFMPATGRRYLDTTAARRMMNCRDLILGDSGRGRRPSNARLAGQLFRCFLSSLALLPFVPVSGPAQANYYNTDAGRPVRVEDAQVLALHALELYLGPVMFERMAGSLGVVAKPGAAYGLVPRTQLQFTVPIVYDRKRAGVAGLDISALAALRGESGAMPAVAARVGVLLPAGGFGPAMTYTSVKAIATRTLPWGRLHLNGQYTFGNDDTLSVAADRARSANGLSRWWAGATMDRAFPLKSLLLNASVFHERPLETDAAGLWRGESGLRYQLSSSLVLDGAVGLRLDTSHRSWSFALGLSRVAATGGLLPGMGVWRRR